MLRLYNILCFLISHFQCIRHIPLGPAEELSRRQGCTHQNHPLSPGDEQVQQHPSGAVRKDSIEKHFEFFEKGY